MRVSVLKGDPGYRNFMIGTEAYLNGKKIEKVVTADEESGEIIKYALKNGIPFIDPETRELAKERLTGRVIIVRPHYCDRIDD